MAPGVLLDRSAAQPLFQPLSRAKRKRQFGSKPLAGVSNIRVRDLDRTVVWLSRLFFSQLTSYIFYVADFFISSFNRLGFFNVFPFSFPPFLFGEQIPQGSNLPVCFEKAAALHSPAHRASARWTWTAFSSASTTFATARASSRSRSRSERNV